MDCLTGDVKVTRADILMDIGASINPAIDIGQIEGAFIQARWQRCPAACLRQQYLGKAQCSTYIAAGAVACRLP